MAERRRDPDNSGKRCLVAPVLCRSEFRNILAGFMRRGTLSFEQAYTIARAAVSVEQRQSSPDVLNFPLTSLIHQRAFDRLNL